MDSALLTTVEQLSDDTPLSRNELNGMWPSGSTLTPAVQSAPAYSSKSQLPGVRDGQNGATEPLDRTTEAGTSYAPRLDPHPAPWRDPAQDRLIDWSATMGSNDSMPGVFTITDRKVRGGDDPFDVSMYVLCRRWVRNDPENNEVMNPVPQSMPDLIKLPEPFPQEEDNSSPPTEPPLPSSSSSEPSTKMLMHRHMAHWLKVREHHVRKINKKCDRYKRRLQTLLNKSAEGSQHSAASPSKQGDHSMLDVTSGVEILV